MATCLCRATSLVVVFAILVAAEASFVQLEKNGYTGLVVAFSPDIAESNREKVLRQAEELFTNASDALFTATRNRAFFKEVTFLVPQSWESVVKTFQDQPGVATFERNGYADVVVLEDHGLFGANPYTLQHRGCGQSALRISLPEAFLVDSEEDNDNDTTSRAKILVREWSHYRYGVFDENGFPDDPRFPLYYGIPGLNSTEVTRCTDGQVQYSPLDMNNEKCEAHLDPNTKFPVSSECRFVPESAEGVQSSLMYRDLLPEVSQFCDDEDHSHNSDAPNKQNALCDRHSTWSVISRSPDFNGRNSPGVKVATTYKYVLESSPCIVAALDTTKTMGKSKFKLIGKAMKEVFTKDYPSGRRIGVVLYDRTVNDHYQIFGDGEFPDFPIDFALDDSSMFTETEQNFKEAVSKSIELIETNGLPIAGSTIILVTAGDIPSADVQSINKTVHDRKVRLVVILCQQTQTSMNVTSTNSVTMWKTHFVPFSTDSWEPTFALLHAAFASAVDGYVWGRIERALIFTGGNRTSGAKEYTFSFDADPTLSSVDVIIAGEEVQQGISFSESTVKNNSESSRIDRWGKDIGDVTRFTFPDAQGRWEVNLKLKAAKPFTVMVFGTLKNSTITVRSTMSTPVQNVDLTDPLVLYAEVHRGVFPVINASVAAVFYHHEKKKRVTIQLLDNGLGDPDITKNDGVYSRYVTGLTDTGYYSYYVLAESKEDTTRIIQGPVMSSETAYKGDFCCGSFIPAKDSHPTGRFSRVTPIATLFVTKVPEKDIYPPNQILDLRISTDPASGKFLLEWTAPGNDYDSGKAERYELRSFEDSKRATENFDSGKVDSGLNFPPNEYGKSEQYTTNPGGSYVAIRAVDSAGNLGRVSNVIQTGNRGDHQEESKIKGDAQTGMIAGIIVAVLVVLILAGVLAVVFFRQRQKKHSVEAPPEAANLRPKTVSANKQAGENDLSTKHHWSASELVAPLKPSPSETRNGHDATQKTSPKDEDSLTNSDKDDSSDEGDYAVAKVEDRDRTRRKAAGLRRTDSDLSSSGQGTAV